MSQDERPHWIQEFQAAMVKKAADAMVRWALERMAHPKRPERTPRKLKKAAKNALARMA